MTDSRKAFVMGTDATTGLPMCNVTRQDSKEACANVADILMNPKTPYTEDGARMVCRITLKGKKPSVKAVAAANGDKSLNRDTTAIMSITPMVAGKTEGRQMYRNYLDQFKTEAEAKAHLAPLTQAHAMLKAKGAGQKRIQARRAAGVVAPDGSVADSDASSVSSELTDEKAAPDVGMADDLMEEAMAFHSARMKLGFPDDFTASWVELTKGKKAASPTGVASLPDGHPDAHKKPAATPRAMKRSLEPSSARGSSKKRHG